MANKGCNRCVHHESSLDDDLGLLKRCLKNNQKQHNLWWQNNGHKTSDDDLDDMDCFEQSEVSKSLDKLHSLLDEIAEVIEKNKK